MHGYGYAYAVSAYPIRVSDGQPDSNTPYPSTDTVKGNCTLCRLLCLGSVLLVLPRRLQWLQRKRPSTQMGTTACWGEACAAQHAVLIHITSNVFNNDLLPYLMPGYGVSPYLRIRYAYRRVRLWNVPYQCITGMSSPDKFALLCAWCNLADASRAKTKLIASIKLTCFSVHLRGLILKGSIVLCVVDGLQYVMSSMEFARHKT